VNNTGYLGPAIFSNPDAYTYDAGQNCGTGNSGNSGNSSPGVDGFICDGVQSNVSSCYSFDECQT